MTTPAKDGPVGCCHFAARPGDLVALDTFSVGKPEGVGPVWQLTAVDTATRHGIGALVAGDKSARDGASFVDHVAERLAGIGSSSPGPDRQRPRRHRPSVHGCDGRARPAPAPDPAPVTQPQPGLGALPGTALQEFYRPAFHRQHVARLADLNAHFQGWLQTYHTRRRNHGDFMRGRTPLTVMTAHRS